MIKGAGHGFKAAGDVVHFTARWRVVTIPVTIALAILGAVAFTQVETEFSFTDFFPEDSDPIVSLELFEENYGESSGTGSGFVYVEGDLTQPDTLVALDDVVAKLDADEAAADDDYLSRDVSGNVTLQQDNAVSVVRARRRFSGRNGKPLESTSSTPTVTVYRTRPRKLPPSTTWPSKTESPPMTASWRIPPTA